MSDEKREGGVIQAVFKAFNPNYDDTTKETAKAMLPSAGGVGGLVDNAAEALSLGSIDSYLKSAQGAVDTEGMSILEAVIRNNDIALKSDFLKMQKAIDIPGSLLSFARMSYMPDATASGVLAWPGVHPDAIRKIIRENIAPNMIINTRVDDVLRYSEPSKHPWKPGWRVEVFQGGQHPTDEDRKKIKEAEEFLWNSGIEFKYSDALKRDHQNLTDFQKFLAFGTRDTLTFDGLAITTERDSKGRITAYGLLPAGNIRLVGPKGYEANKDAYAVAIDETGSVKKAYTREDLLWYIRNPRLDPEYTVSMTHSYGYPEIDQSLKLIQGFQNAFEYNCDIFNRNGTPNGLLLLTGNGWIQKQVDVLMRMWTNLKKGITKSLALPVMAAPQNAEIKVIDFSRIKGNEAVYQDLLNLMIGAFCAIFRFPAHRLGYRISGKGPDSKQDPLSQQAMQDDFDPGLVSLLIHWQNIINQYMIWPRWPNLAFRFSGMNPKEDARAYEFRKNSMTWNEARAETDLEPLDKVVPKHLKEFAELMGMCPIDPNLSGVFQSVAAAFVKGEAKEGEELDAGSIGENKGNTMTSKKDPARSEAHGHASGVRRNSAAESSPSTH